jgi:hypothetical protein
MKRVKEENRGTFCVELWITLDENNRTKSCHTLTKEDQNICQDFPFHGETHILNGLYNEYVKREVFFDLLTKLTSTDDLLQKIIKTGIGKDILMEDIKRDVTSQISKNLEHNLSSIVESVVDELIHRTKLGR